MRSTIAIAAIAGVAAAAPNGVYGPPPPAYGEASSSTPVASSTPAYTPPAYGHVSSSTSCSSSTPVYTPPAYGASSSSAPGYGHVSSAPVYTPKPSSSVPYVTKTVYSTSLVTVTSCGAYVEKCPASSTIVSTIKVPVSTTVCPETEYPEYTPGLKPSKPAHEKPSKHVETVVYPPKETPKVPVKESTTCSESVIVTVTLPSKPAKPVYPTGTPSPYYPAPPAGTGVYVPPAHGTAAPSGYVKPSAPAYFTGAASHANIGGFVAGVGAFAAFFL